MTGMRREADGLGRPRPWVLVLLAVVLALAVGGGRGEADGDREPGPFRLVGTGANDAASKTGGRTFTISGSVTGLLPGIPRPLTLTVTNPHKQDISVRSLTATVTSSVPACPASNVAIAAWSGAVKVNGQSSRVVAQLTATMSSNAPDACAGATFSLVFGGTAVSLP